MPQVAANAQRVYEVLQLEENAFAATLERGQKILEEQLAKAEASKDKVCLEGGGVVGREGPGGQVRDWVC